MIIQIRIKEGWKKAKNIQRFNCDKCAKKLWIAPSGQLYCNEVHEL